MYIEKSKPLIIWNGESKLIQKVASYNVAYIIKKSIYPWLSVIVNVKRSVTFTCSLASIKLNNFLNGQNNHLDRINGCLNENEEP